MHKNLGMIAISALLAMPLAAQAQGTLQGAQDGADTGAAAAGPVGAIVGGAVGAATGTVGGILGVQERPRFRQYVETEHVQSYDYEQPLQVGAVLPGDYTYYNVPAEYHVNPDYRYTVVNHQTVLVDPVSHRVIEVIQ